MATSPMRHSQNWTPDFKKILTRGVKGIREEAQAKLAALTEPRDIVLQEAVPRSRHHHLRCDDDLVQALRALATEMAGKETNPRAKRNCWRSPRYATGFRRIRRAHSGKPSSPSGGASCSTAIEQTSSAMGQGRMDQYLLPFYRKDLAEGRITKESAMELFHCLWLAMSQVTEIKLNPVAAAGTEGFSQFSDVCVGGQTTDGRDATNELSYLILESMRRLQITSPIPACGFMPARPTRFCITSSSASKTARAIRSCSTTKTSSRSTSPTARRCKEALDWHISGCCENRLPNRETNVTARRRHQLRLGHGDDVPHGKLKVLRDIQFG